MMMTTPKLVLFRIFIWTIGRVPFFSNLLRKGMVAFLIRNQRDDPYVPSSKYYHPGELDKGDFD